ncbi:MAG TPA: Vms1/Ankzf1 family peptidyl-tRNA hydrolase [Acidimicrobiales bacterium]|nr:Vms1/Ankzf1 family peptidyl-tRNA hydrolase [Acidimicrobiales bacterium]
MDLADLATLRGPFATVYLTTRSDIPQAGAELGTRWKSVRRGLEDQGASGEVLAALDGALDAADHAAGSTLALVATDAGVVVEAHLPDPPRADAGWLGELPRLATLIEARQRQLPHLLVLADRTGADLFGVTASGRSIVIEAGDGDAENVQKVVSGGWSQRRIQQRAVNTWEENAGEVAEDAARLAKRIDARLVLVGGDVHAVRFLEDALPKDIRPLVREIDGATRHPDGGADHVVDDVQRLVETVVATETAELLAAFKEERGQGDRAADGPARVIESLQWAKVQTLLVHDDPEDVRTAWFGPEPLQVGIDEATVRAMGVDEPREGRSIDVCIRAALGSGAEVRIVPGAVLDRNLGAVLRF